VSRGLSWPLAEVHERDQNRRHETNHGVELLDAVHQGVRSSSNTGRVITLIIREGTPFTTGVHDTISKNQTTTLADEVATAEFL